MSCTNCGNKLKDNIPKFYRTNERYLGECFSSSNVIWTTQDGYKPLHYSSTNCKCHEIDFKYNKFKTAKVPKDFMKNQLEIDDDFDSKNLCAPCYFAWYIKHDGCKKPLTLKSTHIVKLDDVIGNINGVPVLLKHIFKDNTDNSATFSNGYKCRLTMAKLFKDYIFRPCPPLPPGGVASTREEQFDIQKLIYEVLTDWNTMDWQTKVID